MASPPKQLSDFALSDQNSVFRRYSFPKEKVTAMTVADRAGSEQLEPWIRSLYERYGSQIDIDGVADVSMVPKPLHGVVRALFRNRLIHSVMLDWDGSVVKRLQSEPGVANIYVIDRRERNFRAGTLSNNRSCRRRQSNAIIGRRSCCGSMPGDSPIVASRFEP
jgi:hypothetical protein